MERLLGMCAVEGFRPYFLGARPEVLAVAEANVRRRHPMLRLAGSHHGYFSQLDEQRIVEQIRSAKPDCLFVGMTTPKKERFMAAHFATLNVPFVMGVGGGIDVLAGHVRRAPVGWQRNGIEWLFRIWQEPRRMWWRYLSTNTVYAAMLTRAYFNKALHAARG
jgi:N-acetylglucosaminyldiphosphoundecaprenol N-acetyl-beta-D-mannosaminyltransferase